MLAREGGLALGARNVPWAVCLALVWFVAPTGPLPEVLVLGWSESDSDQGCGGLECGAEFGMIPSDP